MNREQVKQAADVIGRLEALEAAYGAASDFPHDAFPISFPSIRIAVDHAGDPTTLMNETGTKAFYPRKVFFDVLDGLICQEHDALDALGVER